MQLSEASSKAGGKGGSPTGAENTHWIHTREGYFPATSEGAGFEPSLPRAATSGCRAQYCYRRCFALRLSYGGERSCAWRKPLPYLGPFQCVATVWGQATS